MEKEWIGNEGKLKIVSSTLVVQFLSDEGKDGNAKWKPPKFQKKIRQFKRKWFTQVRWHIIDQVTSAYTIFSSLTLWLWRSLRILFVYF